MELRTFSPVLEATGCSDEVNKLCNRIYYFDTQLQFLFAELPWEIYLTFLYIM